LGDADEKEPFALAPCFLGHVSDAVIENHDNIPIDSENLTRVDDSGGLDARDARTQCGICDSVANLQESKLRE
jgi:hypothetical protein